MIVGWGLESHISPETQHKSNILMSSIKTLKMVHVKKKKILKKKKLQREQGGLGGGRKVCLDVPCHDKGISSQPRNRSASVRTLGLWLTQLSVLPGERGSYCTDDAVRIGFPPGEKVKLDPYLTPHTHTYKQIPGLKT